MNLKSAGLTIFLVATLFLLCDFVAMSAQDSALNPWNQYRSSIAGFELRYPHDWNVNDKGKEKTWVATFASPAVRDRDVFLAATVTICSNPMEDPFVRTECRERDSHLSDMYKDKVRNRSMQSVGGLSIERRETEDKYGEMFFNYAHFSSHGRSYFVRGDFRRSLGLDRYHPVFDEILTSLRTFAATPVKVFEDARYSFSLSYPDSWKPCPPPRGREVADDDQELLRLVPSGQSCSGSNVIVVSRSVKLLGGAVTGLQLQEMLRRMGFTPIVSPLSGYWVAQGERRGGQLVRESYVFINRLSTRDLLRISERYEMADKVVQLEGREIPLTLNDVPPY